MESKARFLFVAHLKLPIYFFQPIGKTSASNKLAIQQATSPRPLLQLMDRLDQEVGLFGCPVGS